MATMIPLAVSFYASNAGNEPVREWLKSLSKTDIELAMKRWKDIQHEQS